ncbi:SGNH/GDSL hydrolase family protein [Bacillus suaedae]|uniref:SGNH/GDSL hydrolase family protein n=1 Tax=Halalkalibacter suaedae TaxID=2822140 RepID=A0A941APJ1_9BACI|nr:SGNH/GDSL hydrolase family protein [Bacillus suaedae]MBP3952840.1 SGNH/GDSL hydrolase family protein [Bacillus suaedae]
MLFKTGDRILFIGDSITDSDRREDHDERLGWGYVRMIRDYYQASYPNTRMNIVNHGIGGDRVTDLQSRWQEDVIKHSPDYVSISIGINDVWRQLDSPEMKQVYPDQFKEVYTELLKIVKEKTSAQIILMEPTIIEEDIEAKGNLLLKEYVQVIHDLAKQFEAIIVPTHQAFITYLKADSKVSITTDGVHMNSIGNLLMAKTWIESCHEAQRK